MDALDRFLAKQPPQEEPSATPDDAIGRFLGESEPTPAASPDDAMTRFLSQEVPTPPAANALEKENAAALPTQSQTPWGDDIYDANTAAAPALPEKPLPELPPAEGFSEHATDALGAVMAPFAKVIGPKIAPIAKLINPASKPGFTATLITQRDRREYLMQQESRTTREAEELKQINAQIDADGKPIPWDNLGTHFPAPPKNKRGVTATFSDAELSMIAKERGVDVAKLRWLIGTQGAIAEGDDMIGKMQELDTGALTTDNAKKAATNLANLITNPPTTGETASIFMDSVWKAASDKLKLDLTTLSLMDEMLPVPTIIRGATKALAGKLGDGDWRGALDDVAMIAEGRHNTGRTAISMAGGLVVGGAYSGIAAKAAKGVIGTTLTKVAIQEAGGAALKPATVAAISRATQAGGLAYDLADNIGLGALGGALGARGDQAEEVAVSMAAFGLVVQSGMTLGQGAGALRRAWPGNGHGKVPTKGESMSRLFSQAATRAKDDAPVLHAEMEPYVEAGKRFIAGDKDALKGLPAITLDAQGVGFSLGLEAGNTNTWAKKLAEHAIREPKSLLVACERYLTYRNFEKDLGKTAATLSSETELSFFDKLASKPQLAALLDSRLGTQTQILVDRLSKGRALASTQITVGQKEVAPILGNLSKAGIRSIEDAKRIVQIVEEHGRNALPAHELAAVEPLLDFMERTRQFVNKTTRLNIDKVTRVDANGNPLPSEYFMMMPKQGAERVLAFESRAKELGVYDKLKTGQLTDAEVDGWKDTPELAEFHDWLNNTTFQNTGSHATRVVKAFEQATIPDTMFKTRESIMDGYSTARTINQRGDNPVPPWLREYNLAALTSGWLNQTWKFAHMGEDLRELARVSEHLGKRGEVGAQSVLNDMYENLTRGYVSNSAGSYTLKKVTQMELKAKRSQVKLDELIAAKAPESEIAAQRMRLLGSATAARIPDVIASLSASLYPAFLGLKLKSLVQNFSQTALKGIPELGQFYGSQVYIRSAKEIVSSSPSATKKALSWKGMIEDGYAAETSRAAENVRQLQNRPQAILGNQMADNPLVKGASAVGSTIYKAGQKLGDLSMMPFDFSEKLSRYHCLAMADVVFDDLQKGVKGAKDAVSKFDPAYRQAISYSLQRGDMPQVQELVRRYMVGKIMLNYDVASMANVVARAPKVMRMFTKWPTQMVGELNYAAKTGNLTHFSWKYGAGVGALWIGQQLLSSEEEPQSELSRQVFGNDLRKLAPLGVFADVTQGTRFIPPVFQPILQGAATLASNGPAPAVETVAKGYGGLLVGPLFPVTRVYNLAIAMSGEDDEKHSDNPIVRLSSTNN